MIVNGIVVSVVQFEKDKNLNNDLTHFTEIYAIDSVYYNNVIYGLSNGKFAVIKPDLAIYCRLQDVPKMAQSLTKKVRDEVLSIYDDIKSLGLERVW